MIEWPLADRRLTPFDNVQLREPKKTTFILVVLAACLFVSPWLLGYRGENRPEWNAWLVAIALAYMAFAALFEARVWEEWVEIVFGAWLIVAPWILRFSSDMHAAVAQGLIGALVIVVSALALWQARRPPQHPAQ